MMRWLASLILVTALFFGWVGTSYAQIIPQLEINAFGAGNGHTKNRYEVGFPQSVTPISSEFRFDDALSGGVRFNVHSNGHWGEEFYYSFEPNEAHFLRKTAPEKKLDLGIQIHNFGVNGLFYFDSDETAKTRPFLSFGVGATVYRPTAETRIIVRDPLRGNMKDFGQSNEFAFNYGIGFKRRIAGIYGFRYGYASFYGTQPVLQPRAQFRQRDCDRVPGGRGDPQFRGISRNRLLFQEIGPNPSCRNPIRTEVRRVFLLLTMKTRSFHSSGNCSRSGVM